MKRPVFQRRRALRDLRLRAGLTERALGARLGVTAHTIQAWEKGVGRVGQEWRFKLAGHSAAPSPTCATESRLTIEAVTTPQLMPHALLDLLLDMAAHYQAKADEHTMGTSDDATTE